MKKLAVSGSARQLDRRRWTGGLAGGLSALGAGLYSGLTMELGQERGDLPIVH
jgi:hypothetical protein